MLEENNKSSAAVQATAEIRQLQMELDKERDHCSNIQLKLEGRDPNYEDSLVAYNMSVILSLVFCAFPPNQFQRKKY